jgi:hypothetical protein
MSNNYLTNPTYSPGGDSVYNETTSIRLGDPQL